MDETRFSMLIGSMVFALKREASPAEVEEVFRRWDEIKGSLQFASKQLDALDHAVAAIAAGDLAPAKRLLQRH